MAASSDSLQNAGTPAGQDGTVDSAIAEAAAGEVSGAQDAGGAAGWRSSRRWLALAAWAACFAVAFVTTLRLSQTIGSHSDAAAPMLQGWDMLHGNLLQHGWITADVPYFPTEVTEDAFIALVRGLNS